MIGKAWDLVFGYLKARPYWPAVEPFVLLAFLLVAAQVAAYQWLAASTSFQPSVSLYLDSYLSKRITIAVLGLAVALLLFRRRGDAAAEAAAGTPEARRDTRRRLAWRLAGLALVTAAVATGFRLLSPRRVSHITVRFMALPDDVTPEAVAYTIYELNRVQRYWYLEVDFRPFSEEVLTSTEAARCRASPRPRLCHAEALAAGEPFIGITSESLEGAYFAEHRGAVSVVSTFDRAYAPLSTYQYLAYCLVLQSVAIHLDVNGGLPPGAFEDRPRSHGGLFQFLPEKRALKASMLAARLSPGEEALLLNRFGLAYVSACSELLTMDWLYAERVRGNLERAFGATLAR